MDMTYTLMLDDWPHVVIQTIEMTTGFASPSFINNTILNYRRIISVTGTYLHKMKGVL